MQQIESVKALTDEQLQMFEKELLQYDKKYILMFRIGIESGLRISDILNLQKHTVSNRPFKVTETKTKKQRDIFFSDSLYNFVSDYIKILKPNDYIIFSRKKSRHKPLSRVQAYKTMKRVSKDLKIDFIGTHSLRKTYAVNHYRRYKNLPLLQSELNHKYISTTIIYIMDYLF